MHSQYSIFKCIIDFICLHGLDFLFAQPYVKTGIAFLETHYLEVVYQHIRENGSEELVCFHTAKLLNMHEIFSCQPGISADPEYLLTLDLDDEIGNRTLNKKTPDFTFLGVKSGV